jgi:hypothetical protein
LVTSTTEKENFTLKNYFHIHLPTYNSKQWFYETAGKNVDG